MLLQTIVAHKLKQTKKMKTELLAEYRDIEDPQPAATDEVVADEDVVTVRCGSGVMCFYRKQDELPKHQRWALWFLAFVCSGLALYGLSMHAVFVRYYPFKGMGMLVGSEDFYPFYVEVYRSNYAPTYLAAMDHCHLIGPNCIGFSLDPMFNKHAIIYEKQPEDEPSEEAEWVYRGPLTTNTRDEAMTAGTLCKPGWVYYDHDCYFAFDLEVDSILSNWKTFLYAP